MSNLRVTSLRGRTAGSSPTLPDGVVVTGVTTSTSFSGNLTGNASGLTGTPNISCGTGSFTGNVTLQANLDLQDNDRLNIGSGDDLTIRHNGNDTIFENDTGHIYVFNYANGSDITLRSDDGSGGIANYIVCDGSSGKVRLYNYGNQKLDTISSGVNVTGEVQCDGININGAYEQVAEAVSALDINLSTGNFFTKSISSSSTVTFSNPPASGTVGSFTLQLVLTGSSTAITWPNTVYWNGDTGQTAPTLVDARTHLFMFVTTDGGTKYRGAVLSDYTG